MTPSDFLDVSDTNMLKLPSTQPSVPALPPAKPMQLAAVPTRAFGDSTALREAIYQKSLAAAQNIQPVQNNRFSLAIENVDYADPGAFTIAQQKRALLESRTLGRRLRGDWVLRTTDGQEVERKRATLAMIPFLTDRGTIINNGTEYGLISQFRLRPGVYSRIKKNGLIEAHMNVLRGPSHKLELEPETGVFHFAISQAKIPAVNVLRAMGVTQQQMEEAWGPETARANMAKLDPVFNRRLIEKLRIRKKDDESEADAITRTYLNMGLDPEVTQRTLGLDRDHIDADVLMRATSKLMRVSRQEEDPDERDAIPFQTVHGPEDIIAERLTKSRGTLQKALWKMSREGKLGSYVSNALNDDVRSALLGSRLGMALEEVNPAEILDQQQRVSRMGVGGIENAEAVPAESRAVHPTQVGFVDFLRTAESGQVGVDLRFASAARKGADNKLYTRVRAPDGSVVEKNAGDLYDEFVAFPGELNSGKQAIPVVHKGRVISVPKDRVTYEFPPSEQLFSAMANLDAGKAGVKGQRMVMASRMLQQALSLKEGEAPFVRGADADDPTKSYEELYSDKMGAVRSEQPGRIVSVTPDEIVVKQEDGTEKKIELYKDFPFNRKTQLTQTPMVKPGDLVSSGQLLAKSNFTDDKGVMAVGRNLRIAYVPYKGKNWEDAVVMSESAAKKFTSEHMYQHEHEITKQDKLGKQAYVSIFPTKFKKETLDKFDDDGMIKPGTVVQPGDPLFLLVQERERDRKSLLRSGKSAFQDKSLIWDQDYEGVVTDVVNNGKNVSAVVKTYKPSQVGDKFCYSEDTSILTSAGWKPVSQVTLQDKIASLTPDGFVEYLNPVATHAYRHTGRMYEIDTTQISHCVTDNHMLYAKKRGRDTYALHTAESLYKKRYRLKMDADWVGQSPEYVTIPGFIVPCGQGGAGRRRLPDLQIPTHAFMGLLGIYLSEGSVVNKKRKDKHTGYNRRVSISQKKQHGLDRFWQELAPVLEAVGLKPKPIKGYGIGFHDARLSAYFAQFGHCTDKFIPDWVFECNKADLEMLYRWLMWGDGCEGGTGHCYTSTSLRLCQDVQRLCLHTGRAAKVELAQEEGIQIIKGKNCWCNTTYRAHIYREKLRPEINHSHVAKQTRGEADRWVAYDGMVYCVTLPRNHVLYTCRDGKPVWSGNSGRYGDKGLVSEIIPDAEMPHDESGKPFDILVSPLGLTSRINPTQLVEAALGKISEKTGQPYNIKDFDSGVDAAEYAFNELKKHGLSDYETIIDPRTGRRVPNIATGNRWFMKLHHMAADKLQGRGLGGYGSDDSPAGKTDQSDASKRLGMLEVSSLLSSGATEVLREAALIRGQANPEYWSKFMSGYDPATPTVPFVYDKFVNMLRAAGVNPVRNGPKVQLMALTDKAIDELTEGREITNSETVNWKDMSPIKGGLFDPSATGGHATTGRGANLWSHVKLHTPLPNPVMEEPIRRVLGLTKPKFEKIMTRQEQLAGSTGPEAIAKALEQVDLPKLLADTKQAAKSSSKTKRDEAIRKLAILSAADKTGIHPKEWVVSKVPVLPPAFRPVSVMGNKKLPLVDDANYLYKELIDTNNSVKKLAEQLDPDDYADELYGVYKSFKAVAGLGEPQHPKNIERKVRGVIKNIIGPSGPKTGYMQRKLLGSTVDFVSRGVIIPNPDLNMDQVGVPEEKAWSMYQPMIVRRLVRAGLPRLKAMEMVENKDPRARRELLTELDEAVVVVNRAPTLHRYGIVAAKPVLTSNKAIELPPFIFKGLGADVDGDQQIGAIAWRNKFGNISGGVSTHFPAIFTKEGQNVFNKLSVPSLQDSQCFISDLEDFPRTELQRISMVGDLKTEWYGVPEGTQVLGMSPTGECGWFDVQNYSIHPDRALEIVTLQSGRQIYTDNDPRAVFGVGMGNPELRRFTPTDALANKVLVPRVIGDAAPAGPVLQELDLRPFALSNPKAHKLADSLSLDAGIGWFFGAAVGDGWGSKDTEADGYRSVNFAKLRDSTREMFDTQLQRFFASEIHTNTRESVGEYGDRKKNVTASKAAANMLVSFIGHGALKKHLPPWFLNTSREFRNGLLSGLMDTDGCIAVSTEKPEYGKKEQMAPAYSTSSFRLAREVVLLCQSLGIPATVGLFNREGKNTAYTVYISNYAFGEWAVREHKMTDTDKLAALEYRPLEVAPALMRHDRVPITPTLFNALYPLVRKSRNKANLLPEEKTIQYARKRALETGFLTRDTARKFIAFADLKGFTHPELEVLRARTADTTITWDPVVSVEYTGKLETGYDLTVPGAQTFMASNGVILSNTVNLHALVTPEARKEALNKMLPSKNLFSVAKFKAHQMPEKDLIAGLLAASTEEETDKPEIVFATAADAIRAFKRDGNIGLGRRVKILNPGK